MNSSPNENGNETGDRNCVEKPSDHLVSMLLLYYRKNMKLKGGIIINCKLSLAQGFF